MKRPVEWHKMRLESARRTAREKRDAAARYIADAEAIERDCMVLDAQIIRAEFKGIAEFDEDKFNKQRDMNSRLTESRPQGTTPTTQPGSADSSGKAGTEARQQINGATSKVDGGTEHG